MSPLTILLVVALINFYGRTTANCPATLPVKIGNKCYRFQVDPLRFNDARDNCMKIEPGSMITSYKTKEVVEVLEKLVFEHITAKLERTALFWIGIKLDDKSVTKKPLEDRKWNEDMNESQFVQKDYKLWAEDGGPKDAGLACAAINGTQDYKVQGADCGGARLLVICMMKEGEVCKHDFAPYLMYGSYCIAAFQGGAEYNKIHGACSPHYVTPYRDEDMKMYVSTAAKNAFLGGGIYMNMRRNGPMFVDLGDGSMVDKEMWAEGEPRDQYDCVGLSVQLDNTLKLRTMNCEFFAASLCSVDLCREIIYACEVCRDVKKVRKHCRSRPQISCHCRYRPYHADERISAKRVHGCCYMQWSCDLY